MNSFSEAFEDLVKDMYSAEKQILKALPKVAKAAQHPQLRESIQLHMEQTKGQIERLDQVAQICGFKPTGKFCVGAQGLIAEMDEHLKEGEPGPVMDAAIVALAQKVEHYEICGYGTAREWARLMGSAECEQLLEQNLDEEEQTDHLLTELAEAQINEAALNAPAAKPKPKQAKARPGAKKTAA